MSTRDLRAELLAWVEAREKECEAATPGPWEFGHYLGSWLRTVGDPYGHGQMHIADVTMRGWGHMTGTGGGLAWSPVKAAAVQRANARLIAAAPELLEALRAALSKLERESCRHEETHRGGAIWTICDGCGQKWADDRGGFKPYDESVEIAARAAIAKATGR